MGDARWGGSCGELTKDSMISGLRVGRGGAVLLLLVIGWEMHARVFTKICRGLIRTGVRIEGCTRLVVNRFVNSNPFLSHTQKRAQCGKATFRWDSIQHSQGWSGER